MDLKESLDQKVSVYMSSGFVRVGYNTSATDAAKVMQKAGSTEAVVIKDEQPEGIVTERDILYKVVAAGRDPSTVPVIEIMSSPIETIDQEAKVADAIAKMSKEDIRRLGVTRKGELVGMVTQRAVIAGGLHHSLALPELQHPSELTCPYCGETMKDKDELSRHIDRTHVGLGLLEGNLSKW